MFISGHNPEFTCRRAIALIVIYAGLFVLALFG